MPFVEGSNYSVWPSVQFRFSSSFLSISLQQFCTLNTGNFWNYPEHIWKSLHMQFQLVKCFPQLTPSLIPGKYVFIPLHPQGSKIPCLLHNKIKNKDSLLNMEEWLWRHSNVIFNKDHLRNVTFQKVIKVTIQERLTVIFSLNWSSEEVWSYWCIAISECSIPVVFNLDT